MEYRRNTPLAKQMYSPMRQDKPTELGYDDFAPEDIINAYIAHYQNWRSIEEATEYDRSRNDNNLENTNWNLAHKNGSYPEMQKAWVEATEARTRLGTYIPSYEDFERARKELKNPAL